jgi:hypothetical protein
MTDTLIMEFHSDGVDGAELYKRLYDRLDIEFDTGKNVPDGMLVHIPTLFSNGTHLVITEVWATKTQQETFSKQKVVPALAAIEAPLPIRNDWGQTVDTYTSPEVTSRYRR